MCHRRPEGLPFLPGFSYVDPTCTDFRRSHTFRLKNGYCMPRNEYLGIGETHIPEKAISVKNLFEMYNYDPVMTYGYPKPKAPKPLIPAFVALEKKVLRFMGYCKETVPDSPDEVYRVRTVDILYYLEDDSMMVTEPKIENSGLMQGKFLKRHRIPKNELGDTYHWKDLNVSMDIMFYGRVFRIVDADDWTKKYYESEGVIINEPEILPMDPYTDKRYSTTQKRTFTTPDVMLDRTKRLMEFDKRALRFKCIWDDRHSLYGGLRKFDLIYHLSDDCVEVNEEHEPNSGRDPSTLLLHKTRLPKNWKDLPMQFPVVAMEPTQKEIVEYYAPTDFKIGETIMVFGRRFLIYDMDEFTKHYYRDHYGFTDFTPICIDSKKTPRPKIEPPPWNGWGSPEDSLQSWLHIVPQRPRYDAMKRLIFELKVLKFGAIMDSTRPEDQGREFTISYRLVDDKISVYERPVRNSGWPGGKFLDYCRVMRPESSKDNPEYYGPHDFYIGSMLEIFGHRFCLNSADKFVLEFVNANPDCFPEFVKNNIRRYFECMESDQVYKEPERVCNQGRPVCEKPLAEGFFEKLGMGITRHANDPCSENPNSCPMPYDWDMCRQLGYNCGIQRPQMLPGELDPIDQICSNPCPGNPDMFETKDTAVCSPETYLIPPPEMPNPFEEPECIPQKDYYRLKERRFDCFNPPEDTGEC